MPHGTEVTCHVFIFNRNIMVRVHISIRYFGFKLMAIISSRYKRAIIRLLSVWDYVPCFILIARRVARYGASDGNRDERITSMRWTRGPPDL